MFPVLRAAVSHIVFRLLKSKGGGLSPEALAVCACVQAGREGLAAGLSWTFLQILLTRCPCPQPGLAWVFPAYRLLCLGRAELQGTSPGHS